MAINEDIHQEALKRASRTAAEIASSPSQLAEVQLEEAAVLNGHCPDADPKDFIERRLRDLTA